MRTGLSRTDRRGRLSPVGLIVEAAQDRRTDAIRIGTWNLEQLGFREQRREDDDYRKIAAAESGEEDLLAGPQEDVEVRSPQQLHGVIEGAVLGGSKVEQRHRVGRLQPRSGLRLLLEALEGDVFAPDQRDDGHVAPAIWEKDASHA